jgi:hypothetical protein
VAPSLAIAKQEEEQSYFKYAERDTIIFQGYSSIRNDLISYVFSKLFTDNNFRSGSHQNHPSQTMPIH